MSAGPTRPRSTNGSAARGLSYGVHLMVTASRWSELRPALKDLLGTRFELRLPIETQPGPVNGTVRITETR